MVEKSIDCSQLPEYSVPIVAKFLDNSSREVCKVWRSSFDCRKELEGQLLLKAAVPACYSTALVFFKTVQCTIWRRLCSLLYICEEVTIHFKPDQLGIKQMSPDQTMLVFWDTTPETYICAQECHVTLNTEALQQALYKVPEARLLQFGLSNSPASVLLTLTLKNMQTVQHTIPVLTAIPVSITLSASAQQLDVEATVSSLLFQQRLKSLEVQHDIVFFSFHEGGVSIAAQAPTQGHIVCIRHHAAVLASNALLTPTVKICTKHTPFPVVFMWPEAASMAIVDIIAE